VERIGPVAATVQEQPRAIESPPRPGEVSPTARRRLRRNLIFTIGEIICFSTGFAFFDSSTVLASFVASLTGSAILLGLMPTIFQIGVGLPQMAAARFLAHRPRKLPFIVWAAFFRNLPVFLLTAVTWTNQQPVVLLVTFYVCYALFAVGMGVESVAWLDVFAKICPQELRGKVIAIGRTIGNLLSFGAGFVVARILAAEGGFPRNYALIFLAASLLLTAAMIVFGLIKEPVGAPTPVQPGAIPQIPPDDRAVLVQGRRVWRNDLTFRRLTLARVAYVAHLVATPFYFVFARDRLGIDDSTVGLLASGAVMAAEMIGWINLLLDVSPPERRPLYISLHNTLLLPANLLPLLGGVLLTVIPYGVFFPLITLSLLGSLWLVGQVDGGQ
jgi:hypothetical protein